ncbi:AAC(3) family N-acetyltransferase [Gammaproteobacteria bacterium]|nr:AAC(3) family N-acetyltransferase [Gammaproteobacteria bacterium]
MKSDTGPNSTTKPEISERRLLDELEAIGVRKGDHIGLGISFKSLGQVIGGPETFINALLQAVGPEGSIMVNTYTEHFGISRIKTGRVDYVFDYRSTSCNTGLIPETVRKRCNALRSKHPVTSVAAIGQLASYLTDGHGPSSPGFRPYSRLAKKNGKILSIGIGDRLVGFRHEAQYQAGLLGIVPWKLGVNYRDDDGKIKLFVNENPAGCVKTLHELVGSLKKAGVFSEGKIGLAPSLLAPAREALAMMTDMLRIRPSLNLCDDVSCLWCREIERRLDLFRQIEHPQYFQKYRIFVAMIAFVNWFRLGDNWIITRIRKTTSLFP